MIYQLYEIVKEFADEEEKIFLMNKKYEEMGKIKYKFNSSNKVKQLTTSFSYPIDIFEIKDQNILVVFRSGIIQIYDSHLETLMFELLQRHTYSPIIFCRYFDFSYNNSMIYLFEENSCYVFKIIYLSKIEGFKDESAATYYVQMMNLNPVLGRNQQLYDHNHEKLVSPSLKRTYTKFHKR